jgi:hypothetical protein
MSKSSGVDVSKFFEKIAPGGKYFKYSLAALIVLGLGVITLATLVFLPLLTGGKYQNTLSRQFLGKLDDASQPKGTPVPTACPNYNIPSGKQNFNFSVGNSVAGPKIQTAVIDPLDPATGQRQTVTLTIKHSSPVTFAEATLLTDNTQQSSKFRRISGTDTDGTWQLSWQTKDTYKCRYAIQFDLQSSTGNYNEVMHIR